MLRNCLRIQFVLAACVAALAVASTGAAGAAPAGHEAVLPAVVYAPFFETWTTDSLSDIAQQSGASDLTLAFVEGTNKHSCSPAWNGDPRRLVSQRPLRPRHRPAAADGRRRRAVVRRLQRRPHGP